MTERITIDVTPLERVALDELLSGVADNGGLDFIKMFDLTRDYASDYYKTKPAELAKASENLLGKVWEKLVENKFERGDMVTILGETEYSEKYMDKTARVIDCYFNCNLCQVEIVDSGTIIEMPEFELELA